MAEISSRSTREEIRELGPVLTWQALARLAKRGMLPSFRADTRSVFLAGLRQLVGLPPDKWGTLGRAEPARGLAALSGVADPQRVNQIQAILFTTFRTFAEVLRDPASGPHIAALVRTYGREFGTREEDVAALAEVITRTAASSGAAHNESTEEAILEVFTDAELPSRTLSRSTMEAWVKVCETQHGIFDVFMDEETGQLMVQGKAHALAPLEWRLLSCVLRHVGKRLPNTVVGEELWGDETARSSNIDKMYHRLQRSLPLLRDRECVVTQRGWDARLIQPTIHYCLIREALDREEADS